MLAASNGSSRLKRLLLSFPGLLAYNKCPMWLLLPGERIGCVRVGLAEPPLPWRQLESWHQPGKFYYWNMETGATSEGKPDI